MSDAYHSSPLVHRAALRSPDVTLRERPALSLAVLRGALSEVAPAVAATTGLTLPAVSGGAARVGEAAALWLGPDEWLLVASPMVHAGPLTDALRGLHYQLVDVSDYYVAIEVEGVAVRHLLAKLVSVDLHPRYFQPDEAVGTMLAKAPVWLWCTDDAQFSILVRRSLADYVWCLLAEAGREWGLPAQTPVGRVALHLPGADG